MDLASALQQALRAVQAWEGTWGPFDAHPATRVDPGRFEAAFATYLERLGGNYPFFHPRYAGQMLKPPHPAAVAGYVAAMLINPNNHALDGGPPTSEMEKEVVRDLAGLFGFPAGTLGHLTGGGTMANLEALWVAKQLCPGKAVAVSAEAHYTHARMGALLGLEVVEVPAGARGALDADALEALLRTGRVGTVVLTAGTTGLGAVDPVADVVTLRARYDVRLHVDAAYGGFFRLLAGKDDALAPDVARHLRAVEECDSVVVDPHKHGLQPYGCGCVLFRDPSVGRFYRHDSPYTYFTSDALHLGEISLECSRPGAAAGALWLTLQVLPLASHEGLGALLRATRLAALRLARALASSEAFALLVPPVLDIVTYFPRTAGPLASRIDAASAALMTRAMTAAHDPLFLSVLKSPVERVRAAWPLVEADQASVRVLRSVLMKPEHAEATAWLMARLEALAHPEGAA